MKIKQSLALALIAVMVGAGVMWSLLEYSPMRHQHEVHFDLEEDAHESDEHESASHIRLTEDQLKANGIRVERAVITDFVTAISVPGQLVLNTDHEARVSSSVVGTVRSATVQVGSKVKVGDVLATIESPQVSDASARYLAAQARLALAQSTFDREQVLWQKKISAEQDFLAARSVLTEARIEHQSARQSLMSLGLSEKKVRALKAGSHLAQFSLLAPITGTLLSKDLTQGEVVDSEKPLFRIADLSALWIDLAIPVNKMTAVSAGQSVWVSNQSELKTQGRVIFVQPELDRDSQSGSVRVEIDNAEGAWRSGEYVQALIQTAKPKKAISVPLSAIQMLENEPSIFVEEADGLTPRVVVLGERSGDRQEILSGLKEGERFITGNVFVLKADLGKSEAAHDD